MHFIVDQTVTIGGKIVDTVSSVKTRFDSTHVGSICDIVVPLNCAIKYVNGRHDTLTAYALTLFKTGDPVEVTASYTTEAGVNMGEVEIFKGYVWDFKEGMPLTIRCIDYLPILGHLKNITKYSGSLKNLIESILVGTGITLITPTLDLQLVKITFRSISPWAILEYLKKQLGINISLQGTKLYVNVASNTLDVVKYASDRNIHRCDLQKPEAVWQGYKVKAWFLNNNGTRDSLEIGDTDGHCTDVYFYKVAGGTKVHERLAAEALIKLRQRKYSGEVGAFLYPVAKLFDRVEYTDIRYPEKSGNYVITALSHSLDDHGFMVSMRWAFLIDFINLVAQ